MFHEVVRFYVEKLEMAGFSRFCTSSRGGLLARLPRALSNRLLLLSCQGLRRLKRCSALSLRVAPVLSGRLALRLHPAASAVGVSVIATQLIIPVAFLPIAFAFRYLATRIFLPFFVVFFPGCPFLFFSIEAKLLPFFSLEAKSRWSFFCPLKLKMK